MPTMDRRALAAGLAAAAAAPAFKATAASMPRRYRLILNADYSGPVSYLLLAQDRGDLAREGLEIIFTQGDGAAVIVAKVKEPDLDAGYGDMAALIEVIAKSEPNRGPVAIYAAFNSTPFTIAVRADGPIKGPKDLVGRTIAGDSIDAALRTFDLFARATGIDASQVKVVTSTPGMAAQLSRMHKGDGVDGVFGFVNTIISTAAPLGIDGRKEFRFLEYAEYLPDLYGNSLFVTRELYDKDKPALAGMVRAFNRALADTALNPDLAMDALMQRRPDALRAVQRNRLVGTMSSDMANPEGARIGVGDVDDARLARMIALIVKTKGLPRTPSVREVFDRSFLPPDNEKIRTLARTPARP